MKQTDINYLDKLHRLMILHPSLSYVCLSITLVFYIFVIIYYLNKLSFKSLNKVNQNSFYSNLLNLTICSIAIAWGWRFMPPEFMDSIPLRLLLHPRYFSTFIYDTLILLTLFMFLLQIPKIGSYLLYFAIILIFTYTLVGFTTFFHIQRLPSAKEFELGGQIMLISPISYLMLAIKAKPIQFIISYILPLVTTLIIFSKTNTKLLVIKPILSFKMAILFTMIPIIGLGLWVLEKPIKNDPLSFQSYIFFNQNINRLGILKYQLYLLNSDVIHKSNYNPNIVKEQVDEILLKYPADQLKNTEDMPQIILGWASESFIFPESLDPTIKSQDTINPNFKKMLKQGVANSLSSSFPLIGGGTVLGETTLLTTTKFNPPKQNHPSLVSYYKSLGYTTIYMHVVGDSFYSYENRSRYYGFDEIYLGSYFKANWGDDKALFTLVKKRIEQAIENNEKVFISFIDFGRHGPYKFSKNKEELIQKMIKTYAVNNKDILNYIYKSNISDEYFGKAINFINKQKASIALMINADHVPGGFEKEYNILGDEAKYMSNFLFYHNQKKLALPNGYTYIHQSLVPSMFLKSLGMPLRPIDKYILEESKAEKTYKLKIMEQLSYDIAFGQQIAKPIYELKE